MLRSLRGETAPRDRGRRRTGGRWDDEPFGSETAETGATLRCAPDRGVGHARRNRPVPVLLRARSRSRALPRGQRDDPARAGHPRRGAGGPGGGRCRRGRLRRLLVDGRGFPGRPEGPAGLRAPAARDRGGRVGGFRGPAYEKPRPRLGRGGRIGLAVEHGRGPRDGRDPRVPAPRGGRARHPAGRGRGGAGGRGDRRGGAGRRAGPWRVDHGARGGRAARGEALPEGAQGARRSGAGRATPSAGGASRPGTLAREFGEVPVLLFRDRSAPAVARTRPRRACGPRSRGSRASGRVSRAPRSPPPGSARPASAPASPR